MKHSGRGDTESEGYNNDNYEPTDAALERDLEHNAETPDEAGRKMLELKDIFRNCQAGGYSEEFADYEDDLGY